MDSHYSLSKKLVKSPSAWLGSFLVLFVIILALLVPIFSSDGYNNIQLGLKNLAPQKQFWFGTDELGRDIFIRCLWGARISLLVGICAALIDLIIGVLWGSIAAMSSKTIDTLLMRLCDIFYTVPALLITILLIVFLGPGLLTIILALSTIGWINMARIVRGEILKLQKQDFIISTYVLGASKKRVFFVHMLPHLLPTIIATVTLTIRTAIFVEAFLSFLGLGIQAPFASLGMMVHEALTAMRYYPWRLFFPSLFLIVIMLGFNFIGDSVSDNLDPRSKL